MTPSKKQLLVFGYGLAAILAFIGVRFWMKHGQPVLPLILLTAAAVTLGLTLLNLEALKVFYRHWMRVVGVIGLIVTTVIFAIIFYFIFGTVGIILRLMRKDLLNRKWEPQKDSYWVERKILVKDQSSYLQQF